jgi:hypothetical protein
VAFSLDLKDCTTFFAADDHSILCHFISLFVESFNLAIFFHEMSQQDCCKTLDLVINFVIDLFVMKECLLVIVYKNQQNGLIHLDFGRNKDRI